MAKAALEGEGVTRLNGFALDPNDLVIVTDKTHPLFDERANLPLNEGLVLSIMHSGVTTPVLVRKNGSKVELVDGRQRVAAAREANKRLKKAGKPTWKVPVMVRRGDDADVFGVTIAANEHRATDSHVVRARKALRFIEMGGADDKDAGRTAGRNLEAEAAVHFGVSESTIKLWMKLLDCIPAVHKAVEAGHLGFAEAAREFSSKTREEQAEAVKAVEASSEKRTMRTKAGGKQKSQAGVSKARVRKMLALASVRITDDAPTTPMDCLTVREKVLLRWVAGGASDTEFREIFPELKDAMSGKKPKAPKTPKAAKAEKKAV